MNRSAAAPKLYQDGELVLYFDGSLKRNKLIL